MIRKYFVISCSFCLFLILLMSFSHLTWAQTFDDMYGKELKSVPFSIRDHYEKQTGKPWSKATYDERYNYLDNLRTLERDEEIVQQNIKFEKQRVEMQKQMDRQAIKMAEAQKEFEKQRIKDEKKLAEQMKKFEFDRKLMEQKMRIDQARYDEQSRH